MPVLRKSPPQPSPLQPAFVEQSVQQLPTQTQKSRSTDLSGGTIPGPSAISDSGKHTLPLRDLCNEINRKEELQSIRILECESYTEGSLLPHIYLVLPLHDHGRQDVNGTLQVPNAWLRLDRRRGKGSLWRFFFMSSRTVANDEATLTSSRHFVTDIERPGNQQQFEQLVTLQDLGIILEIVCQKLLNYKLFWDNCWAFSSIIEDCLHTLYNSTFITGGIRNRWIANDKRETIRAIAQSRADTTEEASTNKVLRQERKARAGVFQGMIDALLEWCKRHGKVSDSPVASRQQVVNPSAVPSPSPVILSLDPNTGPTTGGIDITILGSHFDGEHTFFFGSNKVEALRQQSNTLTCKLPPNTKPGPVYVAVDSAATTAVGDGGRPNNAVVFTYEDESPLQEILTILQSCTREVKGRRRFSAPILPRLPSMLASRKSQLTLDASNVKVECLAVEVVKLVEEKHAQNPEPVSKSLLRASSKSHRTLLHLSAMLGFDELLGSVVSHAVDLDQLDASGYTALHYAALHGRRESAELLTTGGASVEIMDRLGRPATDVAKDSGHYAVEGMLKEQRSNTASADVAPGAAVQEGIIAFADPAPRSPVSDQPRIRALTERGDLYESRTGNEGAAVVPTLARSIDRPSRRRGAPAEVGPAVQSTPEHVPPPREEAHLVSEVPRSQIGSALRLRSREKGRKKSGRKGEVHPILPPSARPPPPVETEIHEIAAPFLLAEIRSPIPADSGPAPPALNGPTGRLVALEEWQPDSPQPIELEGVERVQEVNYPGEQAPERYVSPQGWVPEIAAVNYPEEQALESAALRYASPQEDVGWVSEIAAVNYQKEQAPESSAPRKHRRHVRRHEKHPGDAVRAPGAGNHHQVRMPETIVPPPRVAERYEEYPGSAERKPDSAATIHRKERTKKRPAREPKIPLRPEERYEEHPGEVGRVQGVVGNNRQRESSTPLSVAPLRPVEQYGERTEEAGSKQDGIKQSMQTPLVPQRVEQFEGYARNYRKESMRGHEPVQPLVRHEERAGTAEKQKQDGAAQNYLQESAQERRARRSVRPPKPAVRYEERAEETVQEQDGTARNYRQEPTQERRSARPPKPVVQHEEYAEQTVQEQDGAARNYRQESTQERRARRSARHPKPVVRYEERVEETVPKQDGAARNYRQESTQERRSARPPKPVVRYEERAEEQKQDGAARQESTQERRSARPPKPVVRYEERAETVPKQHVAAPNYRQASTQERRSVRPPVPVVRYEERAEEVVRKQDGAAPTYRQEPTPERRARRSTRPSQPVERRGEGVERKQDDSARNYQQEKKQEPPALPSASPSQPPRSRKRIEGHRDKER